MPLTGIQLQDQFNEFQLVKGVKVWKINDEVTTFDNPSEGTVATEKAIKGFLDYMGDDIEREYLLKTNGNFFNPKDNILNPRLGPDLTGSFNPTGGDNYPTKVPHTDTPATVLALLTDGDDTSNPNQEIIIYNDNTELRFNRTMEKLNSDIRFRDWTFGVDNYLFVEYDRTNKTFVGKATTDAIALNFTGNMTPDVTAYSYWFNKNDEMWYTSDGVDWTMTDTLCLIGLFSTDATTVLSWDIDTYLNLFSGQNVSAVSNIELELYNTQTIRSKSPNSTITVYDKNIQFTNSYVEWVMPTTGLYFVVGTNYLYVTNQHETYIHSDIPVARFGGMYHPYYLRRCVGEIQVDPTLNITSLTAY